MRDCTREDGSRPAEQPPRRPKTPDMRDMHGDTPPTAGAGEGDGTSPRRRPREDVPPQTAAAPARSAPKQRSHAAAREWLASCSCTLQSSDRTTATMLMPTLEVASPGTSRHRPLARSFCKSRVRNLGSPASWRYSRTERADEYAAYRRPLLDASFLPPAQNHNEVSRSAYLRYSAGLVSRRYEPEGAETCATPLAWTRISTNPGSSTGGAISADPGLSTGEAPSPTLPPPRR